jgi:hypothetical protein
VSRSYASSSAPREPTPPAQAASFRATWSVVLGLMGLFLGLFCCGLGVVLGIPAILVGRLAQVEIAASGGTQGGQRRALAGIVLGALSCLMSVVLIVLGLLGVVDADPRS